MPNDFNAYFARHRRVAAIYFNGGTSRALYERHVTPHLAPAWRAIERSKLPGTSPAHARCSPAEKLELWRVIADARGATSSRP